MAATAYASLVSLLNTLDMIHTHPRLTTTLDHFQTESLRQMVDFFVDFLEKYSDAESREVEDLVRRIADIAREAEDLIEVHAAHRIRAGSTAKSLPVLLSLQRILEEMNLIKEKVSKLKEEAGAGFITQSSMSTHPSSSSSSDPPATSKTTTMVGFDGYVEQLLHQLIGLQSCRQIIPIVGMGGIGKTTLARNLYENSRILHHFDVRAWVTVSQEYNPRDILLQAVSCLNKSIDKMDGRSDDQLGEELHKILYDRRYLIILDDVWTEEAWDKIKFYLPENKNGSRIVVTTRQQELVDYFRGSSAIDVKILDDKNSWKLFCEKAFAQQGCPYPEFEQVGKRIVKKCKGLPLAIVVIGGLLGKSSGTPEYWEKIAEDRNLILESGEGKEVMSILYLSYKHLPVCLKPCFLHLGLFPEDYKINLDQLVKLWVAEGFIKPKRDHSLEEVAESYIENLIDRNLLLGCVRVHYLERMSCIRIGGGRVHDLVRELCIRIGEKENFYCVQRGIDGRLHFSMAMSYPEYPPGRSLVHTRILEGQRVATPSKSRLLRVLFSESDYDHHIQLDSNFREVNSRFLFHRWYEGDTYMLPSSISLLWCLQTLILSCAFDRFVAPVEIWKMPQLRHIDIEQIYLPDPPPGGGEQEDVIVLHNLQTLKSVCNLILTEEVCKRIPNIEELEIHYATWAIGGESLHYDLHNVSCFNKLVSLSYWPDSSDIFRHLANVKLPSSLKRLILSACKLERSDMAMIASLPHLQILILGGVAFVGAEWNMSAEEEFLCLKHLRIDACDDLINWIADRSNFPVLETLELSFLSKLKEIPSGIGEISTLERIQIHNCSESATVSAVGIVEEQQSLGNYDLRLDLYFTHHSESQMLTEKFNQLDSTCHKLRICRFDEVYEYSYCKETY